MKWKAVIVCLLICALGIGLAVLVARRPEPRVLSVSFLGFTNGVDLAFQIGNYAAFQITNHTTKSFAYQGGKVEIQIAGKWIDDTNQFRHFPAAMLVGRGITTALVATSPRPEPWRATLVLTDVTATQKRPVGQSIIEIWRDVGLPYRDRQYRVLSPEIRN